MEPNAAAPRQLLAARRAIITLESKYRGFQPLNVRIFYVDILDKSTVDILGKNYFGIFKSLYKKIEVVSKKFS